MHKQNKRGFTLIELLVVISIMVTLTTVFLANFSSVGKVRSVNIAKNNVVSDLRKMQTNALASKDVSPGVLSGDYGLTFNISTPGSYQLVADDNNGVRQIPLGTYYIPNNAALSAITIIQPNGTVVNPNYIEILFKTTFGRVMTTYTSGGSSGTKETDDIVQLTFTSTADPTLSSTVVVSGITANINQ
ncbi:MAG: hypothetical protein NVSMB66_4060 [Candidatus Doudnabacteria bacterium]